MFSISIAKKMRQENETKQLKIGKEETILSLVTDYKHKKPEIIYRHTVRISKNLTRWLDMK